MYMCKKTKSNRYIRGIFFVIRRTFGYSRKKFGYIEKGTMFTPPIGISNPSNCFIYSSTNLSSVNISAVNAKLVIKKGCAIGENLTVHTGNHARVIGRFVGDVSENNKPEGYDNDVIIEEDVWIGCGVTILCGVKIGRGATIAAGSVVTRDIPPYCVAGGIPARVIKYYWTIADILSHEQCLYSKNERYTEEQLVKIRTFP